MYPSTTIGNEENIPGLENIFADASLFSQIEIISFLPFKMECNYKQ